MCFVCGRGSDRELGGVCWGLGVGGCVGSGQTNRGNVTNGVHMQEVNHFNKMSNPMTPGAASIFYASDKKLSET